jgi:hypothetical protein
VLHCQNTIAIIQKYFTNVLMIAHSVINVPKPKRHQDNAENFGVVSTAMLDYYGYHTKVFYKCFNASAQHN